MKAQPRPEGGKMEEVWEVPSVLSLEWLTMLTMLVWLAMVSDHIISIKFTEVKV